MGRLIAVGLAVQSEFLVQSEGLWTDGPSSHQKATRALLRCASATVTTENATLRAEVFGICSFSWRRESSRKTGSGGKLLPH